MLKVYVKSFGCSANFAEGEIIKGRFAEKNELVNCEKEADLIVLNICTVKGDKKATDEIKKIKRKAPRARIVIAGCIIQSTVDKIKQIKPDTLFVNTHNILNIAELISKKINALEYAKPIKTLQPRIKDNPVVGIVPVSTGCLDACAYCSTRLVKGTLFSFPSEDIGREVRKFVSEGCKEIWITGQDTCCYGFDRKTNLARLLKRLVEIPGDFKIRIGMGNPRHLTKYLNEFIEIMKHPKIFKFVHLPLQAGNDDVLRAMKRGHDVKLFKKIVTAIRNEIPDVTLSTDIIVGHPTETEAQFEDTLKLANEMQFDIVNISRFVPRPETAAAKMQGQVHGNIRKERSRRLTELSHRIAKKCNEKWIGWEGEIIVDNKVKGGVSGRNYAYKPVFVAKELGLGETAYVKITEALPKFLKGKFVRKAFYYNTV